MTDEDAPIADDAPTAEGVQNIEDAVSELHAHLAATGELPIDREANRWLGEAEAVAADLVGADVPRTVVESRVGDVRELLSHVSETGQPDADDHVAAAIRVADAILD